MQFLRPLTTPRGRSLHSYVFLIAPTSAIPASEEYNMFLSGWRAAIPKTLQGIAFCTGRVRLANKDTALQFLHNLFLQRAQNSDYTRQHLGRNIVRMQVRSVGGEYFQTRSKYRCFCEGFLQRKVGDYTEGEIVAFKKFLINFRRSL